MKKFVLIMTAFFAGAFIMTAQNNDWADFGKYRKADSLLTKAPSVVFMGNSITELWYKFDPDYFNNHNYAGRGISGQVSSQMLVRFRPDVIDLHPKVAVILAGTNDLARNNGYISSEHILDNIISMAELAKANGIVPVLCSVLPSEKFGWRPELKPAMEIKELNNMISAYARKENLIYVNYYDSMAMPDGGLNPVYTKDGVHPVPAGYKLMESIIDPVLKKVLAD
ncbi:MAG: GDSL-type esterase/lipase family protein [Bacteroidales bacterium]|nr:GDSL-type esterase/lipase family protein [Bacteroidales bacterium]MCI1785533.1 GDSL-type esterase/lipase family protein [Bacteroidales bacterium]